MTRLNGSAPSAVYAEFNRLHANYSGGHPFSFAS